MAYTGWFGFRAGGCLALFYIYQMNHMCHGNSKINIVVIIITDDLTETYSAVSNVRKNRSHIILTDSMV